MLNKIKEQGIVAVVRAKSHEEAKGYIGACVRGGIKCIELTYSVPNVNELIAELKDDQNLLLGIGSVLNGKMAQDSIDAGAKYVVSPGYNEEVNQVCKKENVLYLPGCMTVTEIMHAYAQGNTMIKLFPGDVFGANYVKAVKAPIPQVEIMPTGGVTIDNVEDWYAKGVSCVGVGSSLLGAGNLEEIEKLAARFMEKINSVKGK